MFRTKFNAPKSRSIYYFIRPFKISVFLVFRPIRAVDNIGPSSMQIKRLPISFLWGGRLFYFLYKTVKMEYTFYNVSFFMLYPLYLLEIWK